MATLTRLGDRAEAVAMADRALASRPVDAELVAALAAGARTGGATDEAEELMRSPARARTLAGTVGAASLLWWRGRPLEAWGLVRDLLQPRSGRGARQARAGAPRKGELEAAKDAYAAAASVDPTHGRAGHWAEVTLGQWIRASGRWHATPPNVVHGAADPRPGAPHRDEKPAVDPGRVHHPYPVHREGPAALGLEPHVVTEFGFPLSIGVEDAPASGLVDHDPASPPASGRRQVPRRPDARLTAGLERLAVLMPEVRPAVLHAASDYRNALLGLRLGELFGLPVVYEVRGFWEESWLVEADRDTSERLVSLAPAARHRVHGTSGRGRDAVGGHGRRDRLARDRTRKITLVPNGVDVERFIRCSRDPELADRWGSGPRT